MTTFLTRFRLNIMQNLVSNSLSFFVLIFDKCDIAFRQKTSARSAVQFSDFSCYYSAYAMVNSDDREKGHVKGKFLHSYMTTVKVNFDLLGNREG